MCKWHQDTLGHRSVVDFENISYVLNTRLKREAQLSTDHYLMVGWIRWWRGMLDDLAHLNVLGGCAGNA